MLTPEHLKDLLRPFRRADYEFRQGFVYLTEEAISARLDEVDPSWAFDILDTHYQNNEAVVSARLTVCSVQRGGIGMATMMTISKKDGKEQPGADPAKSAATDALKRCARLFGIGRHMLNAPGEGPDFDKWLAKLQKDYSTPQPAAPVVPAQPQQQQQAASGAQPTGLTPPDWIAVRRDTLQFFDKNEFAQKAVIERGRREGWLHERMTTALAILAVRDNREVKSAHWSSDTAREKAFKDWASALVNNNTELRDALRNAADGYEVNKLTDWRGGYEEAQAAVVAFTARYDKTAIGTLTSSGMRGDSEDLRLLLWELAVALVDRKPLLAVSAEPVSANGNSHA